MPGETSRGAVRRRFWVETALAVAAGVLAVATLVNDEWIEAVSGFEPDGGDGSLEWLVVTGLAAATAVLGLLARIEWRRATLVSPRAD